MYKIAKNFTQKSFLYNPKFNFSQYDVVIIGGGPGGYVSAIKAGQLGLKTACVEGRGALGGTCLNVGCIPSKALLNISHKYEESVKDFKDLGIELETAPKVNWKQVQSKKNSIVSSLTGGIAGLFKKNKVDYIQGWGSLQNNNTVVVTNDKGENKTLETKNIILATGSEPSPFPGLDFDEKTIVSSTGALSFEKIPESLIVIGGGVIGIELGQVYQRLGTKVTVVEFMDTICATADQDMSKEFQKIVKKKGIQLMTGHKVLGGNNNGDSATIRVQPVKGGEEIQLTAEKVLVCTGRRPYTKGLGLENVGIESDKRGIISVNSHLQTKVNNIFAIGDIIPGPMLAHKAEEEGIAAVEHIAGKGGHINYATIPSVIYTEPEVAWVGKTEQECKSENIKYKIGKFPFLANSRAKANANTDGLIKVITEAETDKLIGVHILGAGAGEMIAEAVLGLEYGASAEDIARTCHAHPTLSEAMKEAMMAAYDKPIHF
ncbi:FAD/NAD-linked reductase, dimerization domain [Pseudocohnilembus persalinus]|uniref:Dihydrolipoyl dehydrogenase n=1 Tax=Pseudocohnilembus persalinus TaxID=266149 RepID=A0A0V0QGY4_PSEPJ|nr:FAD/NAD-linked reductase, dimerization domain [Pseudocohnilembus persalinus]|eukprot:KRX01420.1 FAD/NAD-linked reductase, dimerization domain [Pseudocohnilembus persalinus]